VDPDQDDSGVEAMLTKVKGIVAAHEGEVERVDLWGRRQLAYPIRKKEYGTYVALIATGNASLVSDLNRQLRITDELLRFLVVHKDKYAPDSVPKAKEEPKVERRGDRGDRGDRPDRGRDRGDRGRDRGNSSDSRGGSDSSASKSSEGETSSDAGVQA
jgi:small subunit ribosomal protein S6